MTSEVTIILIEKLLDSLSLEERVAILSTYCIFCGAKEICNCYDQEK